MCVVCARAAGGGEREGGGWAGVKGEGIGDRGWGGGDSNISGDTLTP